MHMIKKLSSMAVDETFGALEYARMAVEKKMDYPDIAETMYRLSGEELSHAMMLHELATAHLEKMKKESSTDAIAAQILYDFIYEMQIDKTNEAKNYQAMYNGNM